MAATGALVTRSCYWGLGRHIYHLSQEQIMNTFKYIVLATAPAVLAVALGRASFCLFLISVIGVDENVRVILWITLVFQALVSATEIILQYSSCGPHIAALWNPMIHVKCIPNQSVLDYIYFLSGLYPCLLG
jgi:rhodopsin domain-containing protein